MLRRLPGDPGVGGWLRFSAGFKLSAENRDWVRHELTDAGWRGRTLLRHLAVILPVCAILGIAAALLVPAPVWLILTTILLILCGSVFSVAAYADDLRASRLRQHGLPVPNDPDLGRPAH